MVNLLDIANKLSQTNSSWVSEQVGNFNGSQVNVRFMHDTIFKTIVVRASCSLEIYSEQDARTTVSKYYLFCLNKA
jgi:hypothetical protein